MHDVEICSTKIVRQLSADVVVCNMGLHFHKAAHYTAALQALFSSIDEIEAGGAMALVMETTPQHFWTKASDGDYDKRSIKDVCLERPVPEQPACREATARCVDGNFAVESCDITALVHHCVPINPMAPNWRNDILRSAATKRPQAVAVVPRAAALVARWDMHPMAEEELYDPAVKLKQMGNRDANPFQDCTHSVYSPLLYEPLWDNIFNAIRGKLSNIETSELPQFQLQDTQTPQPYFGMGS
jgi:hypothetical protein